MIKHTLAITSTLLITFFSYSQDGKKEVLKQFNRPSITNTFITPKTNVEVSLTNYFSSLAIPARFDDRRITKTIVTNELDKPSEALAEQSRSVIAKVWGRDGQGNFHYDQLAEAAKYSSTDGQALTSSASKDNMKVYTEIAENLLKNCFIIAYDFDEIRTYQQYYDAQDEKRRKVAEKSKTAFTPVTRTQEGWVIKYNVSIFKVTWNDSIANSFYNELWLDESVSSDRSQRINKFNQFVFPLELVYSNFLPETEFSSQSNDPKTYESGLIKRLSMDELLAKAPEIIQENLIFKSSKKIDEFRMKASIYNSYPTQAKLGTKEGVYVDERFFVYSIKVKNNGNEKKKRKAVVRAHSISNNSKIATGDMEPSVFKQQGGKKIYSGYLIEMKEDRGFDIMVGQNINNSLSNGIYIGMDYRLSSLTKKMDQTGGVKALSGLYFSLGISVLDAQNVQLFELTESGKNYINSIDPSYLPIIESEYANSKYDCSAVGIYMGLSKEMYPTKRGRLSISPELGFSILSMTATPVDSSLTQDISTMSATLGAKFGINLLPSLEIFAKPVLNYTLPSSLVDYNSSGELLTNAALYSDYINGYTTEPLEKLSAKSGFDKTFKINFPVTLGIRLKF